jgi:hypothetical protein
MTLAFTTRALASLAFFLGANSLYQGNLERKHNFRNIVANIYSGELVLV